MATPLHVPSFQLKQRRSQPVALGKCILQQSHGRLIYGHLANCFSTLSCSGYGCQEHSQFPWYTTDLCSAPMTKNLPYTYTSVFSDGHLSLATSRVAAGEGINAFGVVIQWTTPTTPTDLATTSSVNTLTNSATSSPPSTGTSSTIPTSSSSPVPTPDPGPQSLSKGARAGIGVGAYFALLLLGLGASLINRKRRNRRQVENFAFTSLTPRQDKRGLENTRVGGG